MTTLFRQIALGFAVLCSVSLITMAAQGEPNQRQTDIAAQGAMVMPFNIHNSTHVFLKTADGGTQQVLAKDASDKDLIAAIRMHLGTEAGRFKQGNYSDPMKIHGMDMPGVQYLSKVKPGEIGICYRDIPNGGEIRYSGKDAVTVDAIHKWFDAQLSDHGEDATDKAPSGHHIHTDAKPSSARRLNISSTRSSGSLAPSSSHQVMRATKAPARYCTISSSGTEVSAQPLRIETTSLRTRSAMIL